MSRLNRRKREVVAKEPTQKYNGHYAGGGFIFKPGKCRTKRTHNFGEGDCVDVAICMTKCYPMLCKTAASVLLPIDKGVWR